MDRWAGQVAIVTGASAGIGAEIVDQLLNHGITVVGLALGKENFEKLEKRFKDKKGKFYYIVVDIGKEDVVKAFQWVKENVGVVNILVNSAGILRLSTVMKGNSKDIRDIFDTNVIGLCIATREALKEMQSNKVDGHIVHINSVLGHKTPRESDQNVYSASKYAVTALTETLRTELYLIESKIKVSSISPGFVRTELYNVAMKNKGYTDDDEEGNEIKRLLNEAPALQGKDVADAVIYVLSTPPHVHIPKLIIKPVGETAF